MSTARQYTRPRGKRQRGFTLIEVLVAVVVLSIGLLGLAQLQTYGLRNTNSAALRVDAVNMAQEILERMRANRNSAVAGNYDVAMGGSSSAGGLARADVDAWKQDLDGLLPNGDGSIAVNNGIATVTVQWSEDWDPDAAAGGLARVSLRSEP